MSVQDKSLGLEAARAATLSCHTAASLVTALRKKQLAAGAAMGGFAFSEAARVLRQAEALCRSAVVLLQFDRSAKPEDVAKKSSGAEGGGVGNRKPRRRSRKPKGSKPVVSGMEVDSLYGGQDDPGLVTHQGIAQLSTQLNSLFGGPQSTSPSGGSFNPNAVAHYPVGTMVKVTKLQQQPQHNGMVAKVIQDAGSVHPDGRIAIKLANGGATLRVKAENLEVVPGGGHMDALFKG